MKKRELKLYKEVVLIVLIILFLPTIVWAQSEGFIVKGEINFVKTGEIYVELVTKEEFEKKDDSGECQETPTCLIIAIGEKEQKEQKVSFVFKHVPAGTYGIQAFQDVNGNKKFDMRMLGPKEPWGMSRLAKKPMFRGPKFEEIAFEVNKNISDMKIEVK